MSISAQESAHRAASDAERIVWVDEQDKVLHTQLVPEITDEPDYAAALAALG